MSSYQAYDLRPYQDTAIYKLTDAYLEGLRQVALVMATGLGKTVVASRFIADWDIASHGKAMVLCHTEKLVNQLYDSIYQYNAKKSFIGLEQGPNKSKGWESIIVGTVQSVSRRIKKFDLSEFGLLVIDEAHHNSSKSKQYNSIMDAFAPYPDVFQVNLTATYFRADGVGFADRCQKIVYEYPLLDGVADGWLVKPVPYVIGLKGLKFESTSVNITDEDIDRVLTKNDKSLREFVGKTLAFAKGRKCLFFLQSTRLCEKVCALINEHPEAQGRAAYVHGKLHAQQKKEFFDAVAGGDVTYAIGCDMLIEGFDWPECRCIVVAKPISEHAKSRVIQIGGRGTRPLGEVARKLGSLATAEERKLLIAQSDKPELPILDLVGFSETHTFASCSSIEGKVLSREVYNEIAKIAEELPEAVSMVELEKQALENLAKRKQREAELIEEERKKSFGVYATAVVEAYRKEGMDTPPEDVIEERFKAEKDNPSLEQIDWLRKRGLYDPGMSRSAASRLMASYFQKHAPQWMIDKIKRKFPEFTGDGLDSYKAGAIIQILEARGWTGELPTISRWQVSLKQSPHDSKYRIFVRDPILGKDILVHEPFIMQSVAKQIARKIAGTFKRGTE